MTRTLISYISYTYTIHIYHTHIPRFRPEFEYDDFGRPVILRPKIQYIITQCWDHTASNRLSACDVCDSIREEEEIVIKNIQKQSFLTKTANNLFGKKDSI